MGEVQRLHPHELNNLLTRVRQYLHSNSWETRIAASQAIESIVSNIEPWTPIGNSCLDGSTYIDPLDSTRMKFETFDINLVIEQGQDLLAVQDTEYDVDDDSSSKVSLDADAVKEKVTLQRQLLNKRLGLDALDKLKLGFNSEDMIANEDLVDTSLVKGTSNGRKRSRDHASVSAMVKKSRKERRNSLETERSIDLSDCKSWPLDWFADELMCDLFCPSWEVRHGAATALREMVKLQGKCAGRISDAPHDLMDSLNQKWLEDLSLRLVCVLALDKFCDFGSDQTVAPVRETCAQALGSVAHFMDEVNVKKCSSLLTKLLGQPEWQTRLGALLGLKYLLAVRSDLTPQLLPIVFDSIFLALKDDEDDVSAVAAAALVPVKESLVETLPDKINPTVDFLWDALLQIDDLTSSTASIIQLLSSLLSSTCTLEEKYSDITSVNQLIPRLWPFLGHDLISVRKSVLEALIVLTNARQDLSWMSQETFDHALALIFQRSLVETNQQVFSLLLNAWQALIVKVDKQILYTISARYISYWICLVMSPGKLPIDTSFASWVNVNHKRSTHSDDETFSRNLFLGGIESMSESTNIRENCILISRINSSKLLGMLAFYITRDIEGCTPSPLDCFGNLIMFHLCSKSSIQRMCSGLIVNEWAKYFHENETHHPNSKKCPNDLLVKCVECLQELVYFDEIKPIFSKLQQDVKDFINTIQLSKLPLNQDKFKPGSVLSFELIGDLVNNEFPCLMKSDVKVSAKNRTTLYEKHRALSKCLDEAQNFRSSITTVTNAVIACAVISWKYLPEKLNCLIRPLMDCIKREEKEIIQQLAARHLAHLLNMSPNPSAKVIKNLVTFVSCDPSKTPDFNIVTPSSSSSTAFINQHPLVKIEKDTTAAATDTPTTPVTPSTPMTPDASLSSIITLNKMKKLSERSLRRSSSVNLKKAASSSSSCSTTTTTSSSDLPSTSDSIDLPDAPSEEPSKELVIITRGASMALIEATKLFGQHLPDRLTCLWNYLMQDIGSCDATVTDPENCQKIIQSLQVLETIGSHVHHELHSHLQKLLTPLTLLLQSCFPQIRHMASRCFAVLGTVITKETMHCLLGPVLDMLTSKDNETLRKGAVEAITCTIEALEIKIVPYIVLLIVPMLGRMSDQCESIRLLATHCFAQLVQLMPLDSQLDSSSLELRDELLTKKREERKFLEQLLDPSKVDNFELLAPVKVQLRSYQQAGVNWLAFLNRFNLHGILCDEMGLGKTLMSICILASDHTASVSSNSKSSSKQLPSLVICPPTLTGHWVFEVEKFVDSQYLRALHYTGNPSERNRLKDKVRKEISKSSTLSHNLIVASYDIVRNDIDFFASVTWNYCILDEGHIIKNGKTKLAKVIKSLTANHRLILSGTPIQNNVLELWSLFDFLMPGFLGTERQFMARYSRPILLSRDAKSSSKEQEAGVLAIEALHRQVLPFILRRMKEDVLNDLPPKILQDYHCELSPIQARLYEDFARSHMKSQIDSQLNDSLTNETSDTNTSQKENAQNSKHVFQALQYLRKVCNHPKLVLTESHPEYQAISDQLRSQNSSLGEITHSAKLVALKQLLLDCDIGIQATSGSSLPVVNQHRALIFCQLKSMLDIVENDLLKKHMPSVTYLRLDGSIPPASRHSVVHQFNNDPSIDVLLLTTQVNCDLGEVVFLTLQR